MACFYSAPLAWNPTGVDTQSRGRVGSARLHAPQSRIIAVAGQKFDVTALLDDPAVLQHDDPVRRHDIAEPPAKALDQCVAEINKDRVATTG
jgi:hypothetical protein